MIPLNNSGWSDWVPYFQELTSPALVAGVNTLDDYVVRPGQQLYILEASMECDTIIASLAYIGALVGARLFRFYSSNFTAADTLYGGRRTILMQEGGRMRLYITGAAGAEIAKLWLHGMIRNRIPSPVHTSTK